MKRLAVVLLVLATFLCLPLRPLWVDEIFQLEGTLHQSFPQVMHNAMVAPGGMPLAYVVQKGWLDLTGFSTASARVPAAVFGVGTSFLLFWIARLFNLFPSLALTLGFITPLLLRYATEARPYSQGLFFSALATALFLRWTAKPTFALLFGYLLTCVAGVYSQPFSLFVPCAHALYLLWTDRKRSLPILAVLAVTGTIYVPWLIASRHALLAETWPHEMFFSWAQVSPLMIVREISGGGYVCSISLVLLAAIGLRKRGVQLLAFCIVVPIVLAILADAAFNYFFAIRQLIFVVPPLVLLATAGTAELWKRKRNAAAILIGVFFAGALVKDARWQADRREDWGKAAEALQNRLDGLSGCVEIQPPGDAKHYYFFKPTLKARTCGPNPEETRALVAISPYAPQDQRALGRSAQNVGNTLIRAAPARP